MSSTLRRSLVFVVLFFLASTFAFARMTVNLTTPIPFGQPVGSNVLLLAEVDGNEGTPAYQFSYRPIGGDWRVLRDFTLWAGFEWVSIEEGSYELQVVAETDAGESAVDTLFYTLTPLATFSPRVTPTSHPLVALYSAPKCSAGQIQVRFRPLHGTIWQRTPRKPCTGKTVNFYIGGMRQNTPYIMQQTWFFGGKAVDGPIRTFRTDEIPIPVPAFSQPDPPDFRSSLADPILLTSHVTGDPTLALPVAQDLAGNVVWYYDKLATLEQSGSSVLRPVPGGTFLVRMGQGHILREIDLAGNVIRETNAFQVGEQLLEMGTDFSTSFHHDAVRLPNGHTLVLLSNERILTDVQGPGEQLVIGDMIADLDENLQVTWFWNAFDHFDVNRIAIGDPVCESNGPGCPPVFLRPTGKDWTHSNSLHYVPEDGSILISVRHQDAVLKIDYQDGSGSGEILWELGPGGDFEIISADPYPWFSHPHDAEFENGVLTIFDNGNVRVEAFGGNSRGQALLLDETNMTAFLILNADLGGYSFALGSAQRLSNGNYHFNSGFLNPGPNPSAQSIEVLPNGRINSIIESSTGAIYRSFRLQDMYRP